MERIHIFGSFNWTSTSEEALLTQSQALTFTVIVKRLGANVGFAKGPTGLGKYFMTSPTGEVIFGETLCAFQTKKITRSSKQRARTSTP
ncbi:hypothetical protein LguiA_029455 [Lonicera macranthoides]